MLTALGNKIGLKEMIAVPPFSGGREARAEVETETIASYREANTLLPINKILCICVCICI